MRILFASVLTADQKISRNIVPRTLKIFTQKETCQQLQTTHPDKITKEVPESQPKKSQTDETETLIRLEPLFSQYQT